MNRILLPKFFIPKSSISHLCCFSLSLCLFYYYLGLSSSFRSFLRSFRSFLRSFRSFLRCFIRSLNRTFSHLSKLQISHLLQLSKDNLSIFTHESFIWDSRQLFLLFYIVKHLFESLTIVMRSNFIWHRCFKIILLEHSSCMSSRNLCFGIIVFFNKSIILMFCLRVIN